MKEFEDNNEVMIKISLPLYRSTFERLVAFKDSNGWTHDEAINKLIDLAEETKETKK